MILRTMQVTILARHDELKDNLEGELEFATRLKNLIEFILDREPGFKGAVMAIEFVRKDGT